MAMTRDEMIEALRNDRDHSILESMSGGQMAGEEIKRHLDAYRAPINHVHDYLDIVADEPLLWDREAVMIALATVLKLDFNPDDPNLRAKITHELLGLFPDFNPAKFADFD
jgi:hypothetical protein